MRVLLVSLSEFEVPSPIGGGIDVYVYHLANSLAEQGHEVFCVLKPSRRARFHEKVTVFDANTPRLKLSSNVVGTAIYDGISNIVAFVSALKAFALVNHEIDVIHCHSPLSCALLSLVKGNVPLVYTPHNPTPWICPYDSLYERLARVSIWRCLEIPTWKMADHLIALGKPMRDEMIRWGVPEDRISILHNAVDTELFRPDLEGVDEVLAKYGVEKPYCLFVGQLFPRKGVRYLIKALSGVKGLNCVIVGGGPDLLTLKRLAARHGLSGRVVFTGNVPLEDLRRLYAGAYFFVLPSTAEGLPLVVLEALSSGLPVVASRVAAVTDVIIDGRNGFTFEPRNWRELAGRMRMLLEDESLRDLMAEEARRIAKAYYSWEAHTVRLIHIYNKVLGRS